MLPGIGILSIALTIGTFIWWKGRYTKPGVVMKYATLVARTLELRSGPGPYYRASEVTRAMLAAHVSTKFSSYAYAMFCEVTEFAKAPDCSQLSYDTLRREVADLGVELQDD